jgi:hypothetical protein
MAEKERLYDLISFGSDLEGRKREQAKKALAVLLKVTPEQAENVLVENGMVVQAAVSRETALKYQGALLQLGVRCNHRPTLFTGRKLELVEDKSEEVERPLVCPACGHLHETKPGKPKPEICEACGVVFAKYDDVARRKEERERIRRQLLARHQTALDAEREQMERMENELRRARLEEEIRKELGLPKFLLSRRRLAGTAFMLYVLGASSGMGGLYLYQYLTQGAGFGDSAWTSSRVYAPAGMNPGEIMANMDPAVLAHMQAQALAGAAPAEWQVVGTAEMPAPPMLDGMLKGLENDAEWDRFLAARIGERLTAGDLSGAQRLADHLRAPRRRTEQGYAVVAWMARNGRETEIEAWLDHLTGFAQTLSAEPAADVAALCEIGRRQAEAGRSGGAAGLLQKARAATRKLTEPAARTIAETEIGTLLAALGQPSEAQQAFGRANQALSQIQDPARRLTTLGRIALTHAAAGSRGGALSLLEDMAKGAGSLAGAEDQVRILQEAARYAAELGDSGMALKITQHIGSVPLKDEAVHAVAVEEMAAGRLGDAMETLKMLRNPAYRARGFGLLAVSQQESFLYRPLAGSSSERARKESEAVHNPAERAAVAAELARYAAHAGDTPSAEAYFAEAGRFLSAIQNPADRDRALALLTANEARSLLRAPSLNVATRIGNSGIAAQLVKDLEDVQAVAAAVRR